MVRFEGEILRVEGPVTLDTVPALIEAAAEHIRGAARVVDFAAVTDVDSSAVALSLEWLRIAAGANIALRLVNLPAAMRNLAILYGVNELLQSAAS